MKYSGPWRNIKRERRDQGSEKDLSKIVYFIEPAKKKKKSSDLKHQMTPQISLTNSPFQNKELLVASLRGRDTTPKNSMQHHKGIYLASLGKHPPCIESTRRILKKKTKAIASLLHDLHSLSSRRWVARKTTSSRPDGFYFFILSLWLSSYCTDLNNAMHACKGLADDDTP